MNQKELINVSIQDKIDALKDWIGMEDRFSRIIFKNRKVFELLLNAITDELEIDNIVINEHTIQYDCPNLVGKSNIFDILANINHGQVVNMEFENSDERSKIERAFYHAGQLWTYIVNKNTEPTDVRDTYIIFITRGKSAPSSKLVDEVKFVIDNETLASKLHIIYVNANAKDTSSTLGKFIHDLNEPDPNKMHIKEYADRVAQLKNMKGDLDDMRAIDDALNPIYIAGQKETIKTMLREKWATIDQIVEKCNVSKEFVEQIQKEIDEETR